MKPTMHLVTLAMMVCILAGCAQGGGAESQSPTDRKTGAQANSGSAASCEAAGSLEISATDSTFDKDCLASNAGQAFQVAFDNKDAFGHSFSVFEEEGGEQLFRGEIFSGPKVLVNDIPALGAGSYHFQCDVHPFVMQGVLQIS